jgi:phosphatidylglycerol:prolipoprotein diacylglycerol transferase
MYVLAFIFTWFYMRRRAKLGKIPLSLDDVESAMTWLVVGVVVGGRLGHVLFYEPLYYLQHPIEIFAVWQGGLSFHGGLLACVVFCYIFARKRGIDFLELADAFAVPLAIDQTFGRMGNFINGELFGRVTTVAWAMIFPAAGDLLPRHPSMLYEAGYNLIIGGILFLLRDGKRKPGFLIGLWFMLYAIARGIVEFVRVPDYMVGPLTAGQMLSIPMFIVGLWLVLRKDTRKKVSAAKL